jgi:GH24 family phage-related lysozyme (muramidase)
MAFSFSGPLPNYNALRYPLIAALEGVKLTPYADSVGLATIGVGFLVWAQARTILEKMGYQNPTQAMVNEIVNAVRPNNQDIDFNQPGSGQGATPTSACRMR